MNNSTFNFGEVKVAEKTAYLQPGVYQLSVTGAKYVKPEGTKSDGTPKTPYLEVTMSGKSGSVTSSFYVTPKAFERLQYLYTAISGKACDKSFDSIDAIGAFFEKWFALPQVAATKKWMTVGGRTADNGKVYAEVGFTNYILEDSANLVEHAFELATPDWILNVKKAKGNVSTGTTGALLGAGDFSISEVDDSSLPF